jgi:hypothetical protein
MDSIISGRYAEKIMANTAAVIAKAAGLWRSMI